MKQGKILKSVLIVFCVLAVLCALAAGAWYLNDFRLTVSMQGDPEPTVEYGSGYEDAGAYVQFGGTYFLRCVGDPVLVVDGSVDTERVGDYALRYSSDFLWYHAEAERTVHVVDTVAPELTLTILPDSYVLPGAEYIEDGYAASDNADGELTDRVVSERIGNVIRYTVSDNSGNETVRLRYLHINDPEPPVITLEGSTEFTIQAGHAYEEPGFTALDNVDGDVTDRVSAEGEVNIYHAGDYTLTYTVTDEWGNTGSTERTVHVEAIRQPSTVSPGNKIVYLTFDDGPGKYTQQLLDVLAAYNVKVTFFVVDTGFESMIAKEAAAGHSIGIHSATHSYKTIYASEEAYFADLNTMASIIYAQTGKSTTLIRFPGGSSNTVSRFNEGIMTRLTQAVTDMGYQYFDWNVDSNDAGGATTADEVYENVIAGISSHNVSIVLQHDIKSYSVEAVERILIWGIENGYTFLPLTSSSPTSHHRINN